MADFYQGDGAEAEVGDPGLLGTLFNWIGALMSMALVAGLAVWGYQLAMRDVTGVPVVRALEGPMRIAPEDPGGERAAHQGLAVNSVAAEGAAERPADRLILAPKPLDLTDEDLPQPRLTAEVPEAAEPVPEALVAEAEALAEALADGVTPLSAAVAPAKPQIKVIPASVKGVKRSPLPVPRPIGDLTAEAVAESVALAIAAPAVEVDPDTLAPGTRLVQFGAFPSPEAAREAWAKLDAKYSDFLIDKNRVIQRAVSGGKTFYRLRVAGFEDINDARRFCSTFVADGQACIPVVTR
ncbi:MAG: SPOR domain-containing protein [Rhodobacter sp.]|nr:SPOR domain-containing protein [Rhodobacter sp.]